MVQRTSGIDNRRTDTRDRILSVALRLFAEQGYANTTLREIAEELGVTKAALYFHFKTKEDILAAILRGHLDRLDALVDAAPHPSTPAGREEFLRRIADHQAVWSLHLIKLMRENSTEIGKLSFGTEIRKVQRRLLDALAGPHPTVMDRARARTAFIAIQTLAMPTEWDDANADDLHAAALTVALEVLRGGPANNSPGRHCRRGDPDRPAN
ncbi:TetR/AcrR family transcriptional regulator [Nocardia sp. NPDC050193]